MQFRSPLFHIRRKIGWLKQKENSVYVTYIFSLSYSTNPKLIVKSKPSGMELPTNSFLLLNSYISEEEEQRIVLAVDPKLKRRRYQGTHWDDVIFHYREIELRDDNDDINNTNIIINNNGDEEKNAWNNVIRRMSDTVREHFAHHEEAKDGDGPGSGPPPIQFSVPHLVDLAADGHINPHVDNVKFSGGIIAGLSLLSGRIMRLERVKECQSASASILAGDVEKVERMKRGEIGDCNERTIGGNGKGKGIDLVTKDEELEAVEFYLPPRSLYVIAGPLRYTFTHQILGERSPKHLPELITTGTGTDTGTGDEKEEFSFGRRISIVIRDEK